MKLLHFQLIMAWKITSLYRKNQLRYLGVKLHSNCVAAVEKNLEDIDLEIGFRTDDRI